MPFRWLEPFQRRYMRMLRKNADLLTTVSKGMLDAIGISDRGRMLSNGFDREDLPEAETPRQEDGCFRVVYCGTIEMGRKGIPPRDLTPFFRALRGVIDQGMLKHEQLRLVYAGREGALFTDYARQCGLKDCVENHGPVSREESLRLQREADVLLLASWNTAGRQGILTGKMFEYMMMNRPVVCCVGGELAGSELKRVMTETGIGFCCEQAAGAADQQALEAYTAELVRRWQEKQPLMQEKNETAVEQYHYPQLAQKLDDWIRELEREDA